MHHRKSDRSGATYMTKYAKKVFFQKVTEKKEIKSIWNAIKPIFTNRGIITNDSITFEENGVLKNTRKRPSSIDNLNSQCQDRTTVKNIENYINHPSVVTIKENVLPNSLGCNLPPASKEDVNILFKLSFSLQKTLQCKPCSFKSNGELEKMSRQE